ncbi:hypothetical protein D3C76_731640 [compost metagenome]
MRCTITELAKRAGVSKAAIIQARDQRRLPASLFTLDERGIVCIADADAAERVVRKTIGFRVKGGPRITAYWH